MEAVYHPLTNVAIGFTTNTEQCVEQRFDRIEFG
jgi:hypothetical protein